MTPVQRSNLHRLACSRLTGAVMLGLALAGFGGVSAAESTSPLVPTASGYFLETALPAARGNRPAATRRGELENSATRTETADDCEDAAADNPFCELRWTTGRSRGSDIRARYYEMTDDVKTRLVGKSRAEYFDLDLDHSPEFRFKLRF